MEKLSRRCSELVWSDRGQIQRVLSYIPPPGVVMRIYSALFEMRMRGRCDLMNSRQVSRDRVAPGLCDHVSNGNVIHVFTLQARHVRCIHGM